LVYTGTNQELVQVAATPGIPPPTPNSLNLQPVQGITVTGPLTAGGPLPPFSKPHASPVAVTPLSTLTLATPTTAAPPTPPSISGQVTLQINGTSLNGIQPGVNVLVDFGGPGSPAEIAMVQIVNPYNPVGPTPATITLNLSKAHYNI